MIWPLRLIRLTSIRDRAHCLITIVVKHQLDLRLLGVSSPSLTVLDSVDSGSISGCYLSSGTCFSVREYANVFKIHSAFSMLVERARRAHIRHMAVTVLLL